MCLIFSGCGLAPVNTDPNAKSFNYYKVVEALELNKVFSGPDENTRKELKNNCLENGEVRVTTYGGVDDKVHYTQCGYTPYPTMHSPQRLEKR